MASRLAGRCSALTGLGRSLSSWQEPSARTAELPMPNDIDFCMRACAEEAHATSCL